jgi:hypothetical protein
MAIAELSTIIFVILGVLLIWWIFKKGIALLINSAIGFFALFFASIFLPALKINFWSVIITAIGGIFGFVAVITLHLLGIFF